MKRKELTLVELLDRGLVHCPDQIRPLKEYLGIDVRIPREPNRTNTRTTAEKIARYLCEMGSNDIATFFRDEPVEYSEVVFDVGKKLGAKVAIENSITKNERFILEKLFADTLDRMSPEEKRSLFENMNVDSSDIPYGAAGTLITQVLLKQFGGFLVYRYAVVAANVVAEAVLGAGLSFATNAALTRTIGAFLGPIGWIATGAWLAIDLAGPAYRKTVPAVIHVAYLRQLLEARISIGVVGDGSVGKDSLLRAAFGINTKNVDPVAGSTKSAEIFQMPGYADVHIVNYPGFNDYREEVNKFTDGFLHHTDIFLAVIDINRGVSDTDIQIFKRLKNFHRPILVCANKADLPRHKSDLEKLLGAAGKRLDGAQVIPTVFDPDSRLGGEVIGVGEVRSWVEDRLTEFGKHPDAIRLVFGKSAAG